MKHLPLKTLREGIGRRPTYLCFPRKSPQRIVRKRDCGRHFRIGLADIPCKCHRLPRRKSRGHSRNMPWPPECWSVHPGKCCSYCWQHWLDRSLYYNRCMSMSLLGHTVHSHRPNRKSPCWCQIWHIHQHTAGSSLDSQSHRNSDSAHHCRWCTLHRSGSGCRKRFP